MTTERKIKFAGGAVVFLGALIVYLLCIPSSVSFWDCPEYLLTAMRLEIGHPPGNPFWTLTHRFVTMFVSPAYAALAVNVASAVFSALASLLLYAVTLDVLSRLGGQGRIASCVVSAVCGALMFAWCDSTLFSAVEAEVYSMSIFLTAFTVWLMMRWWRLYPSPEADRLLLLIAYLSGLSLGVHQLNLLVFPVLAAIYVYRRYDSRMMWRMAIALVLSVVAIGGVLVVMMPLTVRVAALCELFAVNTLGWGYLSGLILFAILAIVIVAGALLLVSRVRSHTAYMCVWGTVLMFTGYSCYALILVRGIANPPVNEASPDTPFALERYINREQYGSAPLLYGRTPYSVPMLQEAISSDSVKTYRRIALKAGNPVYGRYYPGVSAGYRSGLVTVDDTTANARVAGKGHGYILTEYNYKPVYTPELDMWLPRITSGDPSDLSEYEAWAGMDTASMTHVATSDAFDANGKPFRRDEAVHTGLRPTYGQNLRFFLTYQLGYMYFRYLMWNFSGRQNDIPSTGEAEHGNFITGIPVVDNLMLGDQSTLPDEAGSANRGRNPYYLLPFILCVGGLIWLICGGKGRRRVAFVSGLLFVMTGIAIVVYLNQSPGEPRERDYAFLGSYMAFAFWGGCGAYALGSLFRRPGMRVAVSSLTLLIPLLMICKNYDDHCRRGRDVATAFSSNVLNSLPRNTVLFVDGDNYTFPLWYAVEGLGIRPDVRVVNINYLAMPSYVDNLAVPTTSAPPVPMTAPRHAFAYGRFARVGIGASCDTVDAIEALRHVYAPAAPESSPEFPSRFIRFAGGEVLDLRDVAALDGAVSRIPLRMLAMIDIAASAAEKGSAAPPVAWLMNLPSRSYAGLRPFTTPGFYVHYLGLSDSASGYADMGAPLRLSGGADNPSVYIDPNAGRHVSFERMASVCRAERLLTDGNLRGAILELQSALEMYPPSVVPLATSALDGKVFHEAERVGKLFVSAGSMLGDTALINKGKGMLAERRASLMAWKRYRDNLPAWLRPAVSYSTRRDIQRIDTVDSLLRPLSTKNVNAGGLTLKPD